MRLGEPADNDIADNRGGSVAEKQEWDDRLVEAGDARKNWGKVGESSEGCTDDQG